jgi:hypothetical protein
MGREIREFEGDDEGSQNSKFKIQKILPPF